MSRRKWEALVGYGASAIAVIGVVVDFLGAESLIRSTWREYFPTFPSEITIKPVEIRSLGAYICATKNTPGILEAAGIEARIVDNDCQRKVNESVERVKSKYPANTLKTVTYTIVVNGLDTDIKTLTLIEGNARHEFTAVLSGKALAHCDTVEGRDGLITNNEELKSIEAIIEHGGSPVSHEINQVKGPDRQALRDSACDDVFTYPH